MLTMTTARRCASWRAHARAFGAASAVLLAGCAAGPDYVKPSFDMPVAYQEPGPWKVAEPRAVDATQAWWGVFGDATLDALMARANEANQDIRQAEARYRQARALAAEARAGFWPSVGLDANAGRARDGKTASGKPATDIGVGLQANWEPDVWGSVRRAVEAGDAGVQASADDVAGARLSMQAELAQDYWQLRVTDLQRELYAATVKADARSLEVTQHQYEAGVVMRSDVALATSQLKAAQAQAADLDATRSQLEHAIAILTGQAPAGFTLVAVPFTMARLRALLPVIPTGLPSDLLERRPDIAAAERRVAVANANIGVARAALFPALTLSASGGFASNQLSSLLQVPSRVWSLGAALAQTLFDGGLLRARSEQAMASYDLAVAEYKGTVLSGLQQVEDQLAVLRVLDRESGLQDEAVAASQVAERSASSQYRAGTGSYLNVLTAQTTLLGNQRTATQLIGRQLAASVVLITAVGGGWSVEPPPRAEADKVSAAAP